MTQQLPQNPEENVQGNVNVNENTKEPLLGQFITDSLASYKPQGRRGTPRGQKIDFSLSKFHASLLALSNHPYLFVSLKTSTAYEVVKFWNTQKNFRDKIQNHCHDFAQLFIGRLLEREKEGVETLEKLIDQPINPCLPRTSFEEFSDFWNYSPRLLWTIDAGIQEYIKNNPDQEMTLMAHYWAVHTHSATVNDIRRNIKTLKQTGDACRVFLLNRVRDKLSVDMDERGRKECSILLNYAINAGRSV